MPDGVEDLTNQVKTFLEERLVGKDVNQSLKTIDDDTTEILGVRTGSELKARGSAEITSVQSIHGELKRLTFQGITFWATSPHVKITCRYKGNTQSERWVWPGGARVDYPWRDSQPKGTITATLHMQAGTNATLAIDADVDNDHNDRPGRFVRDHVAKKLISTIDNLLEEFTRQEINR